MPLHHRPPGELDGQAAMPTLVGADSKQLWCDDAVKAGPVKRFERMM